MPVALDQRVVTEYNERTKREEEYPALHERWIKQVRFVIYQSPPLDVDDQASMDQWKERAGFIQRDLTWLLQLPHDRFWCQVIFDQTLHRCIDSYLKHAPRSYDVVYSLPEDVRQLHDDIHHLVYIVCVRMATYKESKDEHLTPSEFAKIIYENYLFDIPKLMDLCVLYGASYHDDPGNKPLLTKMITNIFSQQPSYEEDLYMVVPTILQVLTNIAVTCGVASTPSSTPLKLDITNMPTLVAMEITQLQDVLFYLSDTAHTLWLFLDVYPPAAKAFMQQDFPIKLASLYESLFPMISSALQERKWTSEGYKQMITTKVHRSQHCILRIFRQIISHCCLMPLLEDIPVEKAETLMENYLHYMSGVLAERRFLCHYERLYPFTEDRDILLQAKYPVDETQLQFIMDAVREAGAIFGRHLPPRSKNKKQKVPKSSSSKVTSGQREGGASGADVGGATAHSTQDYEVPGEEQGACAAPSRKVTEVEMDSLISSVKDLLPDLGDGFIQICLEELDYNTEEVINRILENTLPKVLQKYDRDLPRLPADTETVPEEEPSVLSERRNIYDNDEFDVFSRDTVDTKRIHKGKKENYRGGATVVLDDKSVVSELRPLYDKYGAEDVESMYDVPAGGYDDEYDDTYDECTVGATDADNLDELTNKKRFMAPPRILGRPPPEEEQSDSEEEEEKRSDSFIEDPAKIRQRQEERRQSQMQGRRGYKPGQGSNQGQRSGQESGQRSNQGQKSSRGQPAERKSNKGHRSDQDQPLDQRANPGQRSGQDEGECWNQGEGRRTYDVKGTAKGQGQSADVLKNRAWKEKHKSSRVNHNRRNLADKKRKV